MPDWIYPETWQVGDDLNATVLNRRIRDQNTILLRRPLTVAHNASDVAVPTATDYAFPFDTIDQDDDGMNLSGTPVTNFYIQKEGTYQIWYNVTASGNGTTPPNFQCSIWLNNSSATRRWDVQAKGSSSIGQLFCRSVTGTVFLSVGEFITAHAYQDSGANLTMKAISNTPRIAIMWLGIS